MDLAKLYKNNLLAAICKVLQIISDKKLEKQFKEIIKAGKVLAKLSVDVDQIEIMKFQHVIQNIF
jgi:hypothetical protein